MRFRDVKDKPLEQIEEKLREFRAEQGKMKSQVRSGGAPENAGRLRELRRAIARLETIKSLKVNEAQVTEKTNVGSQKSTEVQATKAPRADKGKDTRGKVRAVPTEGKLKSKGKSAK